MKKFNVLEKQDNIEVRNAQIIYLHNVLGWTCSQIANLVDLSKKTITSYYSKFKHLLEWAKEIFTEVKTTIKNKVNNALHYDNLVTYECEHRKGNCAYIIEYFDSQKRFCFLKVGMTNDIKRRIGEHLREYTKKGFDTTYAVVKELHFAEDEEDALTLENLLRKHYKNIENCGFIKRDRFSNVRYDNQDLQNDKKLCKLMREFEIA